ncbi:glycosyltransferase [Zhouia amylolytica]|uniref:Glycosyltransferase n=1 Tax=Zhouia amylolytica AD3 TaxID=1286632 RepID=W2UQP4_9FLAO|nr:glycosyltransferase [Zhouia amylolytica]ETN95791.1 hypothetical protein P278_15130 [Zhouia amylolytica AD3]
MKDKSPNKQLLLYFSAQLPSKDIPIAGQKVAYSHLTELSKKYDIILFSFINKTEEPFFDPKIYSFCLETNFYRLNKYRKVINHLFSINFPLKVSGRFQYNIMNDLTNTIKRYGIKNMFFEFTSSMLYARKVKDIYKEINIEFVEHDVTYQAFERLSKKNNLLFKYFYKFEYRRMKKFEIESLKFFNKVYTLNRKDKKLLEQANIKDTHVLYPKVDDWICKVKRIPEINTILFLGAMHREENQDAILWFTKEIFPEICIKYPNTILYVVGGGVPDKIKRLASNNIKITGFVENLKPYFEKSGVAVVPLRYGAGIKIKTLETITAKIPTIATTVGAEGIEPNDYLSVADSSKDFINKLIERLSKN